MEGKLNRKHARVVDIDKVIEDECAKSATFRETYEAIEAERNVARALARLRQEKGLSQAEVAKRMHTSQAAVSRAESAEYEGHTWRVIHNYAAALGVAPVLSFAPAHPAHRARPAPKRAKAKTAR